MKKNILMIAVLALSALSMVSCKKDKISENENEKAIIYARMETPKAGGEKTYLGTTIVDGKTPTLWSEGDKVAVFENGSKHMYSLVGGEDTENATFEGDAFQSGSLFCAFYPYNENVSATLNNDEYTVSFTLPQMQTYNENSFGEGACPMVACSETDKFQFHNMTGVLKLHIEAAEDTKSTTVGGIVLRSAKSDDKLWGDASVKVDKYTTAPQMGLINDAGDKNVLYLDCPPNGVDITDDGMDFYFVLPVGALSEGFYVDVYNTSFKPERIDKTNVQGEFIKRSIITSVKDETVTLDEEEDDLLPGKFSISGTEQVRFAKGNLYFDGRKWGFEANQYDYRTWETFDAHINGEDVKTSSGNVGLFFWSWKEKNGNVRNNYGLEEDPKTPTATGTKEFYDWGNALEGQDAWQSIDYDDLKYILYSRSESNKLKGLGKVNGVNGMILLPDGFDCSSFYTFKALGESSNGFGDNVLDEIGWKKLELAGAVFFPAVGYRFYRHYGQNDDRPYVTDIGNSGWYGLDGTATSSGTNVVVNQMKFYCSGNWRIEYAGINIENGTAVRLVKNVLNE